MNRPRKGYKVADVVENMKAFGGDFVLQTMLVRGRVVDNTTPEALEAWYRVVRELKPREIMLYSVSRDTPVAGIVKVPAEELAKAAAPLIAEGFNIQINA